MATIEYNDTGIPSRRPRRGFGIEAAVVSLTRVSPTVGEELRFECTFCISKRQMDSVSSGRSPTSVSENAIANWELVELPEGFLVTGKQEYTLKDTISGIIRKWETERLRTAWAAWAAFSAKGAEEPEVSESAQEDSSRQDSAPVSTQRPSTPTEPSSSGPTPSADPRAAAFSTLAFMHSGEMGEPSRYVASTSQQQSDASRPTPLPTASTIPEVDNPLLKPVPIAGPSEFDWTGIEDWVSDVILAVPREGEILRITVNNVLEESNSEPDDGLANLLTVSYLAGYFSRVAYWNRYGPGRSGMNQILIQVPIPGGNRYFVGGLSGSESNPHWYDETEVSEAFVDAILNVLASSRTQVSIRGGLGRRNSKLTEEDAPTGANLLQSGGRSDSSSESDSGSSEFYSDLAYRVEKLEKQLANNQKRSGGEIETGKTGGSSSKREGERVGDAAKSRAYQPSGLPTQIRSEIRFETNPLTRDSSSHRHGLPPRKKEIYPRFPMFPLIPSPAGPARNPFSESNSSSSDAIFKDCEETQFTWANARTLCRALKMPKDSPWPFVHGSLGWHILYAARHNRALRKHLATVLTCLIDEPVLLDC